MLIRLDLSPGDVTVAVAEGVSLTFRPFTTEIMLDAQAELADRADAEAVDAMGKGEARVAYLQAIARRALISWEGFADAKGAPLDPSPEAVDAAIALVPAVYAAINRHYFVPGILKVQEGNG